MTLDLNSMRAKLENAVGFWEGRQDDARRLLAEAEDWLRQAREALEAFDKEHNT